MTTALLFGSVWLSHWFPHAYQTLWGRAPSPETPPCWWPCRCRSPRHPVGCCGWLTCCAHLPACWKCTALTAPAAALSCTEDNNKHYKWATGRKNMTTYSLLTESPHKTHTSARLWCYRCIILALWMSADPIKERLSANSLTLKLFLSIAHKQARAWQHF